MSDAIDLVGVLVWPLVAVWCLLLFRGPLRDAIKNATRVRIAGQEIRIARERLDMLAVLLDRMEVATPSLGQPDQDQLRRRILDRAERDPVVALTDLQSVIGRTVQDLAESNDWREELSHGTGELWYQLLEVHRLSESPPTVLPALFLYAELQDTVRRANPGLEKSDIVRIVGFGLRVQGFLAGVRWTTTVLASGLPIYKDRDCRRPRKDIRAVLIRTERPGGDDSEKAYPCELDYEPGTRVTRAFDESRRIPPSWWRHPRTGEVVRVWRNGGIDLFAGAPIDGG